MSLLWCKIKSSLSQHRHTGETQKTYAVLISCKFQTIQNWKAFFRWSRPMNKRCRLLGWDQQISRILHIWPPQWNTSISWIQWRNLPVGIHRTWLQNQKLDCYGHAPTSFQTRKTIHQTLYCPGCRSRQGRNLWSNRTFKEEKISNIPSSMITDNINHSAMSQTMAALTLAGMAITGSQPFVGFMSWSGLITFSSLLFPCHPHIPLRHNSLSLPYH